MSEIKKQHKSININKFNLVLVSLKILYLDPKILQN